MQQLEASLGRIWKMTSLNEPVTGGAHHSTTVVALISCVSAVGCAVLAIYSMLPVAYDGDAALGASLLLFVSIATAAVAIRARPCGVLPNIAVAAAILGVLIMVFSVNAPVIDGSFGSGGPVD